MMKAVTLPLGLTVLMATLYISYGQVPAEEAAVNEAVMRQANRIALRQRLADARAAQERHEFALAAKQYDEAWGLVTSIGINNVEAEAVATRTGLAAVRLELARDAQRHSDYREAATQITDVLRVEPSNAEAI